MPFGVFVKLPEEIEVFININNFSWLERVNRPEYFLKKVEEVEAKIIKIDTKNRKIELSIKKLEFDREKELIRKYSNKDDKPKLGDILTEE
ncbi:hypothetical protein AGMMS5026_06460 [Endomicrobiia bacterium]|nr:hypothetical protein AGMMS49523_10230 [Endomicrobiia bacterium]GHT07011.1 hypothetical protein AGMMS49523_10280 [Endomicrobiia bacterium]GHT13633.1 hypothetical protein AGMMS49571_07730 [Endomicrobiia bacterium]GHT19009.1 hypothetical protein AGMMS49929_01820 [Endomicrobiia bacterium]GHT28205.1 hypothetical protein AGMMS49995_08590 [Endomicrobiia bacterium]